MNQKVPFHPILHCLKHDHLQKLSSNRTPISASPATPSATHYAPNPPLPVLATGIMSPDFGSTGITVPPNATDLIPAIGPKLPPLPNQHALVPPASAPSPTSTSPSWILIMTMILLEDSNCPAVPSPRFSPPFLSTISLCPQQQCPYS